MGNVKENISRWISNRRVSLRIKAIFFVTILQIALFLVLTYILVDNFHLMTERMFEDHFVQMAEVLGTGNKHAILNGDRRHLEQEIVQLNRQRDILYAVITDASGEVLASDFDASVTDTAAYLDSGNSMPSHDRPAVQQVGPKPGGFFHASGHLMEIQVPIRSAGQLIGGVKFGVTTEQHNQQLAEYSRTVMGLLLLSFLVVGLLLYFVDRRVRKALHTLITTADEMTKGHLSKRVEINTGDEIETLGLQFNTMADALEERNRQLEEHRKELEERVEKRTRQLAGERNKLRAIIDNVPSAFMLVDKDRIIQTASENFRHIGGFQKDRLVGRYCEPDLWERSVCVDCMIPRAFETGKTLKREYHAQRDGRPRWVEQVIVPIKSNGKVNSVIEILTDITERKQLESQLIRLEKLATTGEMAAVIAHEMRNSVTSVKMILQLLYQSDRFDDEDMESLGVSLDSIGRMERVVNDLLHFAQPRPFAKTFYQINQVVEASLSIVQHQLEHHNIEVQQELDAELPGVSVDPRYLEEAFVNLMLNSIQALENTAHKMIRVATTTESLSTPFSDTFVDRDWQAMPGISGGEREPSPVPAEPVRAELEQRRIQITLEEGTPVLRVEIADNGPGVPEELSNRIFDPFYTTKSNGTGLGLSLVKRIINGHRGVLTYTSDSAGTTFIALFPLIPESVEEYSLEHE